MYKILFCVNVQLKKGSSQLFRNLHSKHTQLVLFTVLFSHLGYKVTTKVNLTYPKLFVRSNYPYIPIYISEHLTGFESIKMKRRERERKTSFSIISIDVQTIPNYPKLQRGVRRNIFGKVMLKIPPFVNKLTFYLLLPFAPSVIIIQ